MFNTLIEAAKTGGITLGSIVFLSILSVFVLVERLLATYGTDHRARVLTDHLIKLIYRGEMEEARAACQSAGAPAGVFGAALSRAAQGKPPQAVLERERQMFNQSLRRRLWVLGTIAASAPFVGLLGTVIGIMESFKSIGETGGGGFAVVSRGLSEALITTAAGIFVAVEAVVFYNFLNARVSGIVFTVRVAAEEFLEVLVQRSGTPVAGSALPASAVARHPEESSHVHVKP